MDMVLDEIYCARACENNMAPFVSDTKEFLSSLDPGHENYNYSKMDPHAANRLTPPRDLAPVTLPVPMLPSKPPAYAYTLDQPAPQCSLCGSEWASKQMEALWCPSSLPNCQHGFCTLCTLEELAQRTSCPICKETIPCYKQNILKGLQNEYASENALQKFQSTNEHLQLHGPLAEVDAKSKEVQRAAQQVAQFLRSEQSPPSLCEKALIDTKLLRTDLVAFANMVPGFRAAWDNPFSDHERKKWASAVVCLHEHLDEQQRIGAEVDFKSLRAVLENDVRKSLGQRFELHSELRLLLDFIVLACQGLYCESHKIRPMRTKNVLRRRSRSQLGK